VTESTRPFPPGSYPVVVIGSGPGGIQVSYALRRNGIEHAVISEDPSPGGMFRRWPHFQRLLSWTKPHAPEPAGSRAYERYDWNSLLADEPQARALQPGLMDGTSYFPSRPEMEQNLGLFAERAGIAIRYGCRWTATRRIDDAEGGGFVVETTDGEYRARVLVVAVGVAEPYSPPGIGMELTHHYADVRPAESYAGHRVLMLGDGVNDVPVLAGADISVAMGSATDLAKTSADAVLLSNRLSSLVQAFGLARRTRRIIVENLVWASLYNGLVLPFAALGWITPIWAALGMSASSLLVVLNALRLTRS